MGYGARAIDGFDRPTDELADVGLYITKHSGRDAWTAVYATESARPEELFPRLVHQLSDCVERGEARIVTSLGERTIICP